MIERNHLATIISAGRDLEGAVPAGSGLRHVTYDNWIQDQPLYV